MDNVTPRWEADALRLGTTLKRCRVALGLTQAELADLSGISRDEYERAETGAWPVRTTADEALRVIAEVVRAVRACAGVDVREMEPHVPAWIRRAS